MTQELTEEESGILAVVHLNKTWPKKRVKRNWQIGRLEIFYNRGSKDNLWGRFGGGWQWKAGFQLGGRTLIIMLLIAELGFSLRPKPKEGEPNNATP